MSARFPFYLLADSVDGMAKEAAAERKAFSRRPGYQRYPNGTLIAVGQLEPFVVTLRGDAVGAGPRSSIGLGKERGRGPGQRAAVLRATDVAGTDCLDLADAARIRRRRLRTQILGVGRRVLAIGGNAESAQLLGVQTTGTKVSVYVLSGLAAGLAGIVLASQTGSVSTDTGKGRELIAIAAVVIGGTLLSGGIGSVLGTFVGLLLMQLIFNVIVFENGRGTISISSYWESVIRGAFLLIVVLVQARVAKRRRR